MPSCKPTPGQSTQDKPIVGVLQQTTAQLRQHEAILDAIAKSAAMLLSAPAPESMLPDVLRLVTSAAGASRAYLFKVEATAAGQTFATSLHRWEAPGFALPPARERVEKEDMSAVGIGSWMLRLAAGEIIVGKIRDFAEAERSFLAAQGVLSVLVVPLFVDGRWWGQIGLDDCESEREWTPSEVDAFKTLAEIIGAALALEKHVAELADANRIIENSPTILFRFAPGRDVPLIYVSQNISHYGYSAEELLRLPTQWARIVHPDDLPAVQADVGNLISGRVDHTRHEFRLVKPDGSTTWFDGRLSAVRDNLGRLVVVEGFGVDIVERKRAEADRALLVAIVESSSDAIISETLTGTITSWNRGAEQMFGYRADEIIGRSVHEIVGEERRTEIDEIFEKLARGERVAQYEINGARKNGTRIALSISRSSIRDSAGNIVGSSTIARDITVQKQAADALAYRDRLLHAVTVGTAVLVTAGSLEQGMPQALRIVGESMQVDRVLVVQNVPDQAPGTALRYFWQVPDIQVPLDPIIFAALGVDPAAIAAWQAPINNGQPMITQLATSEGPIRGLLERLQMKSILQVPIFVGNHELWGFFGIDACTSVREWTATETDTLKIFADATGALIQRNATQLSLEKSEERFRVVSETAQDGIIIIDRLGRIDYWNQSAERILGYSAEEVAGRPVHDFLAPERFRKDEEFQRDRRRPRARQDGRVSRAPEGRDGDRHRAFGGGCTGRR
jgi:PAS domain S-box-containing protein